MNAIPVTRPATVIDTLQPAGTDPLSMKKNAVAAKHANDTTQNVIPTKSSGAKRTLSAFTLPTKPIKAIAANVNTCNIFIRNSTNI